MEVVPVSFIRFLNEWELTVFPFLSLLLQILLLTLGNRRKYVCRLWIRVILWCAYISADWVAIISLGIIAKSTLDQCNNSINKDPGLELRWFWAQFFLLHLGGPDTITAYSIEDNGLWLRHLVGMLIQTGFAFYVLLFAFSGSYWLPSLGVLIFLAGLIKYVERLCSLSTADIDIVPDPGPNFAKLMEEYSWKKLAEELCVGVDEVVEIPVRPPQAGIPEAYDLFLTFKRLFTDALLSFGDRDRSQTYFKNLSGKQAFGVVEIELGLMFDEMYTKASIVYNLRGCLLRMITFSVSLFAWVAFLLVCEKGKYKQLDLVITHSLLVVAICLEIYAAWDIVDSDWARHRLSRGDKTVCFPLRSVIQWCQKPIKKRWSKKMAQHNLLDLCLRHRSVIRKVSKIDTYLERYWHKSFVNVSTELEELLFLELNTYTSYSDGRSSILNRKGSLTLENYASLSLRSLDWMRDTEFHQRILIWHIATDICCSIEPVDDECKLADCSKHISDYMLYLLIVCPFMLPIGIGMKRFRDTCAEARKFFSWKDAMMSSKAKACRLLLEVNTEVGPIQVKGDRSKSVLFEACVLAKALLTEAEKGQRWEIISKVWVEMLAHAATHCHSAHHARQLRKGGEMMKKRIHKHPSKKNRRRHHPPPPPTSHSPTFPQNSLPAPDNRFPRRKLPVSPEIIRVETTPSL